MARKKPEHLVVIGASAGGIDALSRLISTLPADLPAPIVVAQHLDPRRDSHLQEILARRAKLAVRTVEDRERLAAETLYVVPSHRHVEIRDGEVRLVEDGAGRPQPSIDLLLTSAAQGYGEHLTAVILTGSGSDGAEGARRVKAAGGTVIVQDPATAEFPSMPRSLAPTTVDITAELESIGPLLVELLNAPKDGVKGSQTEAFETFLQLVHDESGIDFASYKRPTIMRRLQRRMTATGMEDLEQYTAHLREHPDELQRLTSSFLLKVTEFFRDPALFERIRAEWLPELVGDARRRGEELRVWSAGSATGEEAYSLAILVAEALDEAHGEPSARIFATDLDDAAVGFARRGVYPSAAFDNLPPALRERYVSTLDGESEVVKDVRSLVVFGQHDLGQRAPFPRMDLVLCRNVLIYFQPALQERALRLFAFSLRHGGYLALGKAETTAAVRGSFSLVDRALKVYRRTGSREPFPSVQPSEPARPPRPLVAARPAAPALDLAVIRARRDADQKRMLADRADRVLLGLKTGIVVVDEHYDISRINAAARELLSIHGTAIGDDFVHLAVGLPSSELRACIDRALHGEPDGTAVFAASTSAVDSGEGAMIEVSCTRVRSDAQDPTSVIIELRDVTASEAARASLEARLQDAETAAKRARDAEARESADRVDALGEALAERDRRIEQQSARAIRLADTHRQVIAANRELTDTNAILSSSNDELLIASEEAQAATEEVETLNEELQATNEELETLNEELQATIEELNATNAELAARTTQIEVAIDELAEARDLTERQRQRLATTMGSMGDAVMMVDEHGKSLLTNAAYDEIFAGAGGASTIEVEGGQPMPSRDALQRRAAMGETFVTLFALRAPDGSRRWFEAHGRPLRGDDGARGGVVAIRDITDRSLRELQDQFVAMVAHELRTPLTAMSGYVELLRRELSEAAGDDRARRFADRAVASAGRMSGLVRDLLDANRLQRGGLDYVLEPLDLAALVKETVDITGPINDGVAISLTGAGTSVMVSGDAGRLQQVILNLLSNAVRHGGAGGRVELSLKQEKSNVMLTVRDHGPGIAKADLPNLFTRFYQGAGDGESGTGGLGLGLYISRQIVEAHDGTVEARSRPGRGASFVVSIPLLDAPGRASRRRRGRPVVRRKP